MVRVRTWASRLARITMAAVSAALVLLTISLALPRHGAPLPSVTYPEGCAAYGLSQRRCDAVVAAARDRAHLSASAGASIELLPCDPAAGPCPDRPQFVARVRLRLSDVRFIDETFICGGVGGQFSLICTEHPQIQVATNIDHDTMCSGPMKDDPLATPSGCTTPIPSPDASTLAASRPLVVSSLDVPVSGVGHHEVEVGRAVLPNGYVAEASLSLRDPAPAGVLLDGVLRLHVRSAVPGRPSFGNVYQRGTFQGLEEVVVYLVFDALEAVPGAVLPIKDLVVR